MFVGKSVLLMALFRAWATVSSRLRVEPGPWPLSSAPSDAAAHAAFVPAVRDDLSAAP